MPFAIAPDGSRLHFQVNGKQGAPAIMLGYPWTTRMARISAAGGGVDQARLEALNQGFIDVLAERYRIVHMDYPRGSEPSDPPKPGDLTVETVVSDHLAIADAAGIKRFVLVGYSWSSNAALQVASRTSRCAGLVIGAWPPLSAPYAEVLAQLNVALSMLDETAPDTRFLAMIARNYQSVLDGWDEEVEVPKIAGPKVTFFGANDVGVPAAGLAAPIAERTRSRRADLERLGWTVMELPGFDHNISDNRLVLDIVLGALEGHSW